MKMAAVNFNDQYLEVESWHQGGGLLNLDFERVILSLDVSDKVLGQSIIIDLNAGKLFRPKMLKVFYSLQS
nr:contact-dependent growth inhibition system immunity protein [uncultured Acinetobacter sp.]